MTRYFFLSLLLILIANHSTAEYGGWYIKFTLETTSNANITGHIYVASAYFDKDSINRPHYVIEKFDQLTQIQNDTITFFRNRIAYNYIPYGGPDTVTAYTLVNEDLISVQSIRSIVIDEMIDFSYLVGIGSELSLRDQRWMKRAPVQSLGEGGYLCDWQIFIHKRTRQTDRVVEELNAFNDAYNARVEELNERLKHVDGQEYIDAEEELKSLEESIDSAKRDMIKKFNKMKVVVVVFCSC